LAKLLNRHLCYCQVTIIQSASCGSLCSKRFVSQELGIYSVIGIIIVAHGGLSKEYIAAVEHVVGKQKGLIAISIEENHDRKKKEEEICSAANSVDMGNGVIIVTDMFGGSPSNLSLLACKPKNRKILYGANLPMLVKLAKSRHLEIGQAVDTALHAGRKYIASGDG